MASKRRIDHLLFPKEQTTFIEDDFQSGESLKLLHKSMSQQTSHISYLREFQPLILDYFAQNYSFIYNPENSLSSSVQLNNHLLRTFQNFLTFQQQDRFGEILRNIHHLSLTTFFFIERFEAGKEQKIESYLNSAIRLGEYVAQLKVYRHEPVITTAKKVRDASHREQTKRQKESQQIDEAIMEAYETLKIKKRTISALARDISPKLEPRYILKPSAIRKRLARILSSKET